MSEPRVQAVPRTASAGDRRRPRPTSGPAGDALTALGFLTRLPVTDDRPLDTARLSRAAAWFPAVGLITGGALGGTRMLGDLGLPAGPSTVLALVVAALVTGALHDDGLADTADALGAHTTRERRLEILRDPRLGTYGTLALVLAALLAYAALSGLDGQQCLRAALVAHVLGRWSILPHSLLLPPARPEGAGALLHVAPTALIAGTATAIAVAMLAAGLVPGALALGLAVLVTAGAGAGVYQALGGVTGDTYGATSKLVEVATYLALAAVWT